MLSGFGNAPLSYIGTLDPRLRVVLTAAFAVLLVLCRQWTALLAGLAVAGGLVVLSRQLNRHTLRRLTEVNLFVLMLLVFMPVSTPGETLWQWGGAQWSREGLEQAIRIGLVANSVMLACGALLMTMEPAHLGFALSRLRVPGKLVHVFLFMVRYIDVIFFEYRRLQCAMKLRGFTARCSLHSLRSIGYLVGMLFVRSIDRADRIVEAMKCRGFDGHFHVLEHFSFARRDAVFGGAFFLVLAGLGLLEWTG
jgi:cobalt/nickel transport system permease protein